jgi:7-carboxy-7-deazaguanine synthase
MSGTEVLDKIKSFNCNFIEFTGGEPLLQTDIFPLISLLCDSSYLVAVETNGACDISQLDRRVKRVIDIKTPSSGEEKSFYLPNIKHISNNDEVKFVIADAVDFDYAINIINQFQLQKKAGEILFSPAFNSLEPAVLADWIMQSMLPIRLSLQLHKYIWNPDERCR